MLELRTSARFNRDVKRMKKRGKDMSLLIETITALQNKQKLPDRYYDHALTGNLKGFRECHIQPDWLLIYSVNLTELILFAQRTGTHSDLLGI